MLCVLRNVLEGLRLPPAAGGSAHAEEPGTCVAGLGVIQQRALDGRRGSFHPPAVVRADDRVGRRIVIWRMIGTATRPSSLSTHDTKLVAMGVCDSLTR